MPEIAWDLWTHQNGILHEKDKVVLRSKIQWLDQKLMAALRELPAHSIPAHDWNSLSLCLSRLLKNDRIYKEVRLQQAMTVMNAKCKTLLRKRKSLGTLIQWMQRSMQQFLRARRH
jgi:hypothetical protein